MEIFRLNTFLHQQLDRRYCYYLSILVFLTNWSVFLAASLLNDSKMSGTSKCIEKNTERLVVTNRVCRWLIIRYIT